MKKIIIIIIILIVSIIEVNAITCFCSTCNDCEAQINNISCDTIKLNSNINNQVGSCIINPINFSNKIFDCNNYIIDGDGVGGDTGIYFVTKTNIIIKNCEINDFAYGIYARTSSNSNTINNNEFNNNERGIFIQTSSNNDIYENEFYNNNYGVFINSSANNNLTENIANYNNFHGFLIQTSASGNIIDNNEIKLNGISGIKLHLVAFSNIIKNNVIDSNIDYGIYISGNSNTLDNNSIINSIDIGLFLGFSSTNNIINDSFICNNTNYDIYDVGAVNNIGNNNTCDKTINWSDEGVNCGCFNLCSYIDCSCYTCLDCECKLNRPDCKEVILMNNINFNGTCIAGTNAPEFKEKVFNCDYKTITGNREETLNFGIFLYRNNYGNVIKNCYIDNFTDGIRLLYSNDNILQNIILKNNTHGIYVYGSNNLKITNSDIIQSFETALSIQRCSNIDLSTLSIFNNTGYGAVFTNNENLDLISSNILLNKGGLYMLRSTGDIKYNIICRNMEKDENRYDIYEEYKLATGYNNYCDYSYNWIDIGVDKGCLFLCSGNYTPTEYNVTTNETIPLEPQNITNETREKINQSRIIIPSFVSFTNIIENAGFKTDNSKILFVIFFKVIIDIILAIKGLNWRIVLIINLVILLSFCLMGWVPFWIVLLIMAISGLIFALIFKKLST